MELDDANGAVDDYRWLCDQYDCILLVPPHSPLRESLHLALSQDDDDRDALTGWHVHLRYGQSAYCCGVGDFPAMRQIFDKIKENPWPHVTAIIL